MISLENIKLEILKYKAYNNFLSILKNNKEESLNLFLEGFDKAEINKEENYLELFKINGKDENGLDKVSKAMVKFEAFEEKGLINRTEYKYSVRLTDGNIFAKFTYETERKKLDYMIVNNDVDGKYVARYEGEMVSKKGNVEAIRGVSKSYTYDSLNRLKPLIPFKNLNGAVAYRNIKNFSNRYLPSYEDTFDLEVFGDRAYFKYNDKQQEELIKEYDKKQAIQVAFNSYINGDLRPSDVLVKQKERTLR